MAKNREEQDECFHLPRDRSGKVCVSVHCFLAVSLVTRMNISQPKCTMWVCSELLEHATASNTIQTLQFDTVLLLANTIHHWCWLQLSLAGSVSVHIRQMLETGPPRPMSVLLIDWAINIVKSLWLQGLGVSYLGLGWVQVWGLVPACCERILSWKTSINTAKCGGRGAAW